MRREGEQGPDDGLGGPGRQKAGLSGKWIGIIIAAALL